LNGEWTLDSIVTRESERAGALIALRQDQVKKLGALAHLRSAGTDESGEDLLQRAYARWLGSDAPVSDPESTFAYLCLAIKGERSNILRRKKLVRRVHGERAEPDPETGYDPVESAPDGGTSQEDALFIQQVYDMCGGDEEIQMLLMHQRDQTPRSEIQKDLGWDDKKYESVKRRKTRLFARWISEGEL
jgi:DNA-directed RNA polymerase specialized sigma24 family protein